MQIKRNSKLCPREHTPALCHRLKVSSQVSRSMVKGQRSKVKVKLEVCNASGMGILVFDYYRRNRIRMELCSSGRDMRTGEMDMKKPTKPGCRLNYELRFMRCGNFYGRERGLIRKSDGKRNWVALETAMGNAARDWDRDWEFKNPFLQTSRTNVTKIKSLINLYHHSTHSYQVASAFGKHWV